MKKLLIKSRSKNLVETVLISPNHRIRISRVAYTHTRESWGLPQTEKVISTTILWIIKEGKGLLIAFGYRHTLKGKTQKSSM